MPRICWWGFESIENYFQLSQKAFNFIVCTIPKEQEEEITKNMYTLWSIKAHIAKKKKENFRVCLTLLIANVIGKWESARRWRQWRRKLYIRKVDVICGNDDVVFYYQAIFPYSLRARERESKWICKFEVENSPCLLLLLIVTFNLMKFIVSFFLVMV